MKFVSVVLTFAAVILVSAALRPSPPTLTVNVACYAHETCRTSLGLHCFCEKPENNPEGVCICNEKPKNWDECMSDEDCIGHPDSYNGSRWCGCHREYYLQPKGKCVCNKHLG